MNKTLAMFFLLAFSVSIAAKTIVVDPSGSGDFTSIQPAISDPNTVAGDEIAILPGTYTERVQFFGKAITLKGVGDPNTIIIERTLGFNHSEEPNSVLTNLTIAGLGDGIELNHGSSPTIIGCIIRNNTLRGLSLQGGSSPDIINCIIRDNDSHGFLNQSSSPKVTNCQIINNSGSGIYNKGGGGGPGGGSHPIVTNCLIKDNKNSGMYIIDQSNPQVYDTVFHLNSAMGNGGGVYFETNSVGAYFVRCTFINNSTGNDHSEDKGGGFYCNGGQIHIRSCDFTNNYAAYFGGGIYFTGSVPNVSHCSFTYNNAGHSGGGIAIETAFNGVAIGHSIFEGNTANNWAGGVFITNATGGGIHNSLFFNNSSGNLGTVYYGTSTSMHLTNCTFYNNAVTTPTSVGGFHNAESPDTQVRNCIFWNNSPAGGVVDPSPANDLVGYCNIQGGYSGEGEGLIDANPIFINPGIDFRLTPDSPCFNAGTTDVAVLAEFDLAGQQRVISGQIDIGAYEIWYCPLLGDLNCDLTVDIFDLALLAANWLVTVANPSDLLSTR